MGASIELAWTLAFLLFLFSDLRELRLHRFR